MITGVNIKNIIEECGTARETKFLDMKRVLELHGFTIMGERKSVQSVKQLPEIAMLSLETPRCWHWSLYVQGVVYDPEHGILSDFPQSKRKYYWEITAGE